MLGDEDTRNGGFLDRNSAAQKIRAISDQYGLAVDPETYIKDLPVGVQQRVEIIKLLYREADILIMDEPTAVLTPQEADDLFKILHSLVEKGKSIIFITHKLREVMDVADRITVIRRGKVIGATTPAEADQRKLANMMVGREVILDLEKPPAKVGETVLQVKDLLVLDDRHQVAVDEVSFDVRAGEVLGIAGVQGNGQTELVEALTGLRTAQSGSVRIDNQDFTHTTPRQLTELGVAHVPEDRQQDGLVLSFPVADNLVLNNYYLSPYTKGVVLQHNVILENAQNLIKTFDIRTPSAQTNAGSLSGGNQQKVIVAREFSRPTKLLVAAQPTRGLDVGSVEYIHTRILEKRDEGCAVLLVSAELDEIFELSDRIAVMFRGKIVDILPCTQATKEGVGLLMMGMKAETAP
jgi:simple sugar transport system ATP-binding protein